MSTRESPSSSERHRSPALAVGSGSPRWPRVWRGPAPRSRVARRSGVLGAHRPTVRPIRGDSDVPHPVDFNRRTGQQGHCFLGLGQTGNVSTGLIDEGLPVPHQRGFVVDQADVDVLVDRPAPRTPLTVPIRPRRPDGTGRGEGRRRRSGSPIQSRSRRSASRRHDPGCPSSGRRRPRAFAHDARVCHEPSSRSRLTPPRPIDHQRHVTIASGGVTHRWATPRR